MDQSFGATINTVGYIAALAAWRGKDSTAISADVQKVCWWHSRRDEDGQSGTDDLCAGLLAYHASWMETLADVFTAKLYCHPAGQETVSRESRWVCMVDLYEFTRSSISFVDEKQCFKQGQVVAGNWRASSHASLVCLWLAVFVSKSHLYGRRQ